ncbi:hypothetical protein [Rugamonas apoptosis]|uniref:Lipoprotein n=1 Tax=Rugamonas apoptosis TaxID=2758570 RepID=A0A7W2FEJ9_9BURK|nr:hypothetical protein [Rugamonas apoptosis]MBA5690281.1 hypothetical protein [Rugamonas apoptosis]
MKSLYLRAGLAVLCGATLAGCGGGSGSLQLGGTIVGLSKPGLVLKNGASTIAVTADTGYTTFTFPDLVANDASFDIEYQAQPDPKLATCDTIIQNNKGKANIYTVRQAIVTCHSTTYSLGGTVRGLVGKGLVLANGSQTVPVSAPATAGDPVSFTFPTQVPNGSNYGVTVLAQPTDDNGNPTVKCVVNSPAAVMPAAPVSTLDVSCSK